MRWVLIKLRRQEPGGEAAGAMMNMQCQAATESLLLQLCQSSCPVTFRSLVLKALNMSLQGQHWYDASRPHKPASAPTPEPIHPSGRQLRRESRDMSREPTCQSAVRVVGAMRGMTPDVRSLDMIQNSHQSPSGRWRTLAASLHIQKYIARSSKHRAACCCMHAHQ